MKKPKGKKMPTPVADVEFNKQGMTSTQWADAIVGLYVSSNLPGQTRQLAALGIPDFSGDPGEKRERIATVLLYLLDTDQISLSAFAKTTAAFDTHADGMRRAALPSKFIPA